MPSTVAVVPSDSGDTYFAYDASINVHTNTATAKEFIDIDISGF